jgi:uncharacterized SAM-dependent methyltransferase
MAVGAQIIDIRVDTAQSDIVADVKKGLRPEDGGEKTLPTMLLYSESGLKLFESITYLEEVRLHISLVHLSLTPGQYYLTNAEIEILENYADQIAQRIQSGSILVELGSG